MFSSLSLSFCLWRSLETYPYQSRTSKFFLNKLSSLLHQQHVYWKQRGSVKWVTLGDGSTKFFHANANVRFRRNLISVLEDGSGNLLSVHAGKASLIWNSFRERLGTSSYSGIHFDLSNLMITDLDFSSLVTPF